MSDISIEDLELNINVKLRVRACWEEHEADLDMRKDASVTVEVRGQLAQHPLYHLIMGALADVALKQMMNHLRVPDLEEVRLRSVVELLKVSKQLHDFAVNDGTYRYIRERTDCESEDDQESGAEEAF